MKNDNKKFKITTIKQMVANIYITIQNIILVFINKNIMSICKKIDIGISNSTVT